MTQATLSPSATTAFEKSHIRATAPATRTGMTTVSPLAHLRISSAAFASLSKKPADTGRLKAVGPLPWKATSVL
jgi:hypothetical protein